jgi:alpha-L-fucosidase 2
MVDTELRQLLEQGYVAATLRCSHDPCIAPMPGAQGGIPTIMMEMLLYSRPAAIEVLPALPPTLLKGSINGMLSRTFARVDKLKWDMDIRAVELKVTSFRKQEVTLMARDRRDHREPERSGGAASGWQSQPRYASAGEQAGDHPHRPRPPQPD